MSYRVIQWSTGNVGRYCLRQILDHPELELTGVLVTSEAKDGKDAGDLCERPKTGIRATRDAEALLALDADCVVYTATADRRPFDAVKDIARILASGKSVVSSSVVGLVHPRHLGERVTAQLEEACAKGESSFFTNGIDPGFANDLLPLVLSGLCGTWEEIRIQEIINYATYAQPEVLFDTMGFGQPMDAKPVILMPGALGFAWGGTIKLLAEGLGLTLDRIEEWHERLPATRRLDIQGHIIEPGTMGALRFEVRGIVGGKSVLVVEHVTRMDDALAPEWPQGNGSYRVLVKGVPGMKCEYEFWDEHGDHAVGGVVLTATRLVNAIPAVCDAPPGLLSALDLPLITGKGLLRA
jgi:4-hydroxy-tetrahydrodipicolinate reductase